MVGTKKIPVIKDGVQAIVLVGSARDILNQKIVLVQDFNDRGRGDGLRLLGLPGGGIEPGERPEKSLQRELSEEVALYVKRNSLKKFGCYTKLRPCGAINNNHLFVARLKSFKERKTNDPNEVSRILVISLKEIIDKAHLGLVHEGSIRLILNFLSGKRSGSLNEQSHYGVYHF